MNLRSFLRIFLPLSVFLYCAGFHYSYVKWVSPVWAYEGLTYTLPNSALLALAYGLAVLLTLISPPLLLKPSHAIYWVLFFMVYIPGMFVPLFIQLDGEFALLALQASLTAAMLILALFARVPTLALKRYPLNSGLFWAAFFLIYLTSYAVMIAVYHGNMRLASLQDMYSIRHASSRVLQANPFTGYVSQMLANVLNPLLLAYGFERRKKRLWITGILGQLVIYSIFANKLAILSPLVIGVLYFTIRKDWGAWVPKATIFLALMFATLTTVVVGLGSGIIFNIATVAIVRNFAIPGMLVGQYQYFFENKEHTYMSNVAGLSAFVPDSYDLPVGQEVSAFYGAKNDAERGRINGNANIFATDGIAAFGLWGIPLAGVLCALVLWLLDGVTKNYTIEFAVAAMTMVIYSLTNTSIFTTLLGNGLLAWMALFIFLPRSFSVAVNREVRDQVYRPVFHGESAIDLHGQRL